MNAVKWVRYGGIIIMEQEERFIIIKIGREHYGIKINDVKEVVPNTGITNVPEKQSAYICGIMKCRYGCVSVFDIYKLFNIESVPMSKMVIILTIDGKMLAFAAENVDCVVSILSENIYDIPSIFNDASQRYMQNVIVSDNKLVPIIDTARLFHIKEQTLTEKWPLNLKGCLSTYPRKCRHFKHFRGFCLLYELVYKRKPKSFLLKSVRTI